MKSNAATEGIAPSTGSFTDQEKQSRLREGKPLVFSAPMSEVPESEAVQAARTLKAKWLEDLLEEPARLVRVPIEIANAIIEGELKFKHATFEDEVLITDSEFTDEVDFSFATFKRDALFDGSRFLKKSANFRATHAECDFKINRTRFAGGTSFENLRVDFTLYASGAIFGDSLLLSARDFKDLSSLIRKVRTPPDPVSMFLWEQFSVETRQFLTDPNSTPQQQQSALQKDLNKILRGESIYGDQRFAGVVLSPETLRLKVQKPLGEGLVRFNRLLLEDAYPLEIRSGLFGHVIFDRIEIGNSAFFRPYDEFTPVRFESEVRFLGAHIGGQANFSGAYFAQQATFDGIKIDGGAFFRSDEWGNQVRFGGKVRFLHAVIAAQASFRGAQFAQQADFERIQVNGDAYFFSDEYRKRVRFQGEASFLNAHITGNAEFNGALFEKKADFRGIEIDGSAYFNPSEKSEAVRFRNEANFSNAHIKGAAKFMGARFGQSANFSLIEIGANASFSPSVQFGGEAAFIRAHIKGQTDFRGAKFAQLAKFDFLQAENGAFFRSDDKGKSTRFSGEVRFIGAHICGDADFSGAQFEKGGSFQRVHIEGSVFFTSDKDNSLRFADLAQFNGARVLGEINFRGAQFEKHANFEHILVDGTADFSPDEKGNPVRFARGVSFGGAHLKAWAWFNGVQFGRTAAFDGVRINGSALFDSVKSNSTRFRGRASFINAHIAGQLQFGGSQFDRDACFDGMSVEGTALFYADQQDEPVRFNGDASLEGARFTGLARFRGAQFKGKAVFTAAVASNEIRFEKAVFHQSVNFQTAHFRVAVFRDEITEDIPAGSGPQFLGHVDLHGFTYERISVAWRELLAGLFPYNRQAYTHLERFFRSTGLDHQAGDVHLNRRRRESSILWRRVRGKSGTGDFRKWQALSGIPKAIADLLWRILCNYGVRPYRLLVFSLLIVGFGIGMFSLPGAVIQKEKELRGREPILLSVSDAFRVSLRLFVPAIELPSGNEWVPNETTRCPQFAIPFTGYTIPIAARLSFADYATLHRLAGAILVPLGLAALTGLLRRQDRP